MIDVALNTVVAELNEFMKNKFGLSDDRVVLSNLVGQDGSLAVKSENKVVVTLVNVQQERVATPKQSGKSQGTNPPVCLNLFLLFSASFNEKLNSEALKFLSAVVGFFQSKSYFSPQNSPELPSTIEKLIFDIYNTTFHEQSNIWGFVGAKYMPSVVYKVRMVVIEEGLIEYTSEPVTGRDTDSNLE